MRALVIQPEAGNGAALVGERLRQHGFELVDVVLSDDHGEALDAELGRPAEYDVVIAMGSIRSVYEVDVRPWITDELEFLRRADEEGVAVLGICFGAQALAAAHGGHVVRAERPQVGWHPLDGAASGLPDGPWMQWHHDRIEPPVTATLLAADEHCVQAFAVGRAVGVQFHPEITREHLASWLEGGGSSELRALGIDPDLLLAETDAIQADVTARTNRLVDWFLSEVAGFGPGVLSGNPETVTDEVDEVVVVERAAGRVVDA